MPFPDSALTYSQLCSSTQTVKVPAFMYLECQLNPTILAWFLPHDLIENFSRFLLIFHLIYNEHTEDFGDLVSDHAVALDKHRGKM